MKCIAIFALALLSLSNARVTFPNSEILQAPDLINNKANFKCKNQCKVYVDRKSDKLMITQNGNIMETFNTIVSGNAFAPTGVVLPPGDNYVLENRGEPNPEFVLYIVDIKAPNFGAPLYAPQETIGVSFQGPSRYATFLSSFEAMWFSTFAGAFPSGYPRIYATGFDAAGDTNCHPVYQARSQYNAEMSWPTIATAVFTVDFGFVGPHNVSVNYKTIKDPFKAAGESTVYTSPGYVGCSFNSGQNYYSKISQVQEAFTLTADSLDIDASYYGIGPGEPFQFTVSNKTNNLVGSGTYSDHYDKGTYDVSLWWARETPGSSFAIQLDFGNGSGRMITLAMSCIIVLIFAN
ncbi:hypothetical protein PENTCL1PPCAC_20512, partial [Pristionchus entomophagus]